MSNEAIYIYTVGCQRDPWHEEGEQAVVFFLIGLFLYSLPHERSCLENNK